MTRYYSIIIAALMLVSVIVSCDDNDSSDLNICQNIVTFIGNNTNTSVYEYREINDSPIVTLTIDGVLDPTAVKPGERLLMTYTLPKGVEYGQSGHVNLRSLQYIYTDTVEIVNTSSIDDIDGEPINVKTLFRSGEYINLTAQLPNTNNRSFSIVADQTTMGNPIPDIYIFTINRNSMPTYNSNTVASFFINDVWSRSDVEGVRVHINNSAYPNQSIFEFKKQQ